MAELLRALLARRDVRLFLGATVLLLIVAFVADGLNRGFGADRCAEALVEAITKNDVASIQKTVKNPTLREAFIAAERAELNFVRPLSSEWSRVGIRTETGEDSDTVMLQLRPDGDACTFVRDAP